MIPELVACFDRTTAYIRQLVSDLPDDAMLLQPAGAPNNAAWTLGHIVHSYQAMAGELGVNPWLPDDWETSFGYGTSPRAVANSAYSSGARLIICLSDATERLRTALLDTDERCLAEPSRDAASRDVLPTRGDALLQIMIAHTAFHAGQLAAWRRVIGRDPVGVFI